MQKRSLNDTRATSCPKMPPSEEAYAYGVFQYGVQSLGVWTYYW
jgi:hypothetical protein